MGIAERGRHRSRTAGASGSPSDAAATAPASTRPPSIRFSSSISSGKLVKSFGAGLLVSPHGIYVDRDGNIWVTDYQDNAPRPARGAAARPAGPAPPAARGTGSAARVAARRDERPSGLQVQPGRQAPDDARRARRRASIPNYFFQPNDVIVARTARSSSRRATVRASRRS